MGVNGFNTEADEWEVLNPTPENVDQGGALTSANGYIFALRGDLTTDFWRLTPENSIYLPLLHKGLPSLNETSE